MMKEQPTDGTIDSWVQYTRFLESELKNAYKILDCMIKDHKEYTDYEKSKRYL